MIPHPQSYQTIHALEQRARIAQAAREHLADQAAPPATPAAIVARVGRRIATLLTAIALPGSSPTATDRGATTTGRALADAGEAAAVSP